MGPPLEVMGGGAGSGPLVAAVLGASGNVGSALVRQLSARERWGEIHVIGRREAPQLAGIPRVTQHVVDMGNLRAEAEELLRRIRVHSCFVCLGVGAPSKLPKGEEGKRELMRIDCELPAQFAEAAKAAGAAHFSLLTSVGADEKAQYSGCTHTGAGGGWYNHVKGVAERRVRELHFPTAAAIRPGTILGNTNTPGCWACLAPKLDCCLPAAWHSIHVDEIGVAMARQAEQAAAGEAPEWYVAEGPTLHCFCK
eukprot:TRINITY_DN202_c0_g1_i5.p2 TRINITY_DN202_c0_g1~~TRINITY_DN202_c0_g1_i5.p2  ORF type:complete len:287 (+),score=116.05 TRINITY_DN202_c0_g1_i5:104-862(+)